MSMIVPAVAIEAIKDWIVPDEVVLVSIADFGEFFGGVGGRTFIGGLLLPLPVEGGDDG
jgi:hypothetical protein